jgi:Cep192 domain 4/Abnormal spindle-like microcephaly-assoc'd, ASPM-SPD-2-Hydin
MSDVPACTALGHESYEIHPHRNTARSDANLNRFRVWAQAVHHCGRSTILLLSVFGIFLFSGCGFYAAKAPSAADALVISPGSISFGSVTVGHAVTANISLTNQGSTAVAISALSVSGKPFSATSQTTLPVTLAAGASLVLNVQFDPTSTGTATGQLTVTSNSLDTPTVAAALSGTGTASVSTAELTINATTISFGSVTVNTSSTQFLTLTSSGTAPVTASSAVVTGTGFSISGLTFPLTLNPGQSATLYVQFSPTTTGAGSGQLTITSNSSTNPTATISLSGTSGASGSYQVDLSWNAPLGSPDPVVGYHIYRSTDGGNTFALLDSTVDTQTTYADTVVLIGKTYVYVVKSVDASGAESAPSNTTTATIP